MSMETPGQQPGNFKNRISKFFDQNKEKESTGGHDLPDGSWQNGPIIVEAPFTMDDESFAWRLTTKLIPLELARGKTLEQIEDELIGNIERGHANAAVTGTPTEEEYRDSLAGTQKAFADFRADSHAAPSEEALPEAEITDFGPFTLETYKNPEQLRVVLDAAIKGAENRAYDPAYVVGLARKFLTIHMRSGKMSIRKIAEARRVIREASEAKGVTGEVTRPRAESTRQAGERVSGRFVKFDEMKLRADDFRNAQALRTRVREFFQATRANGGSTDRIYTTIMIELRMNRDNLSAVEFKAAERIIEEESRG